MKALCDIFEFFSSQIFHLTSDTLFPLKRYDKSPRPGMYITEGHIICGEPQKVRQRVHQNRLMIRFLFNFSKFIGQKMPDKA